MALPIAIGAWFFAPAFLSLVYGQGFLPAVFPFRILLGYLLLAHIYCPFYYLLQACGKEKAFMKCMMAGAVVGMGANVILIPAYGSTGAALAKVAAHGIMLVFMYRATCRGIVMVPLVKEVLRSMALAVPMVIALWLTPWVWPISLGIGLTIYAAVVALYTRKAWLGVLLSS